MAYKNIIWVESGVVTESKKILEETDFGYKKIVGQKDVVIGNNTLATNNDTGVIGTVSYHRGYGKWVLEVSFCKDVINMTHCDSIGTVQYDKNIDAFFALGKIIECTQKEIISFDMFTNQQISA